MSSKYVVHIKDILPLNLLIVQGVIPTTPSFVRDFKRNETNKKSKFDFFELVNCDFFQIGEYKFFFAAHIYILGPSQGLKIRGRWLVVLWWA